MIVYTVRGGASAVIWTDVVQLFVYVAGAAVVFVSLLALIPGGWAEVVRAGVGGRQVPRLRSAARRCREPYTFWAGIIGGVALTLSTHGTDQFLVQRLLAARSSREAARGLVLSGVLVFAQFVLFLAHRRDAVHLLPARAAAARARAQRRAAAHLHRHGAVARRRRVHRRRDRRRRAVAVDQRDGGDDGERLLS